MLFKKCKKTLLISTIAMLSLSSISFAKNIEDFKDLDPDAWYANAIQEALDLNLFKGVNEDEFAPNADITRGMFVTVLGRKANISEVIDGREFDDVDSNAYYANSVKWAAKNGIVKGIGENLFAPEKEVTREDVAVIVDRYFKDNQENGDLEEIEFSDRDEISEYAIRSIKWAAKNNI
ncbi:MAG: S-layer homology domain-containing protein, partial [Andreesenia angusta]|nr:S-layer homology domain-containing protein [Andreesenia angusta]